MIKLTEAEWKQLKALWAEPLSYQLLEKCFTQEIERMKEELLTATEATFRLLQSNIITLKMLWRAMDELAKKETYQDACAFTEEHRKAFRRLI